VADPEKTENNKMLNPRNFVEENAPKDATKRNVVPKNPKDVHKP
jgi:hypothetical protein